MLRFDVVWPIKSCESEDSGVGRENVSGEGMELEEELEEEKEELEEEEEPGLQFAKCRAGIQLYRELSLLSRPELPVVSRPEVSRQEREENFSHLSHLVSLMAGMRLEDQRCPLPLSMLDRKQRKHSVRPKVTALTSKTASYKSYKETILELEEKKLPLPQILLLPTSQWRIHQPPPEEGSGNDDDLSISRSFITSSSAYG